MGSCKHPGNIKPVSSPFFDSILSAAEKKYDEGDKSFALLFVRKKHSEATNLSVEDEMNYYAYVSTIYEKGYRDYDKCIELADSMVYLLEKSGYLKDLVVRQIQAYNIKADALYFKGAYNEAYKTYFAAKLLGSASGDSCSVSMFSYHMGMILYRQKKYSSSVVYFKQAYNEILSCDENYTHFYRRQEILDNIGLCYSKASRHDSALMYYRQSLSYIDSRYNKYPDKSQSVYDAAKAVIYGNMADDYLAAGKQDSAIILLKESIATNLQKGYTNSDAEVDQMKLANIYWASNNKVLFKDLLDKVGAELDTIPNKNVEMQWNSQMYQYYAGEKDSITACRYAIKYVKLNDSFQEANRALTESDIAGTMRTMERQHQLVLLKTEKEKNDIYLIIVAVTAAMLIVVIIMIQRNSSRAEKDLKKLKELNNEISSQKQKLEGLLLQLETRDKEKSRILRSVAHDVMSPISAISALTDILLMEGENLNDEQKEILNLMHEACGNSLGLSQEIIDAADTIDPARMAKEKTDINKLVSGSVELLNVKATLKKQTITLVQEDKNIIANVNKDKIRRVIENLIGNAIKFSFENSSIIVTLSHKDGNVLITVKDSGVGISENGKANIFDMFTESRTYGTSGEKPHGIGLSIALQVAKAHGGDIWFESEEGVGTAFYFSFPEQA